MPQLVRPFTLGWFLGACGHLSKGFWFCRFFSDVSLVTRSSQPASYLCLPQPSPCPSHFPSLRTGPRATPILGVKRLNPEEREEGVGGELGAVCPSAGAAQGPEADAVAAEAQCFSHFLPDSPSYFVSVVAWRQPHLRLSVQPGLTPHPWECGLSFSYWPG